MLSSHSFCSFFPSFSIGCSLSPYFVLPRSPHAVLPSRLWTSPFPSSFAFVHLFSLCLHPFLPSGLAISSYFSAIFQLGRIASQPLSSGLSFFFSLHSLLLLFDEPICTHKHSAYVVVALSTPLSPYHIGILV